MASLLGCSFFNSNISEVQAGLNHCHNPGFKNPGSTFEAFDALLDLLG
jgi:hypothetical protein